MTQDLWYALKVRPRFERSVVTHLRGRGYDPFFPTYTVKHQWSDRVKSIELPLFPGYLFCRFELNSRQGVLTTPGLSFIVGNGRIPQAIPDEEIQSIRTLVSSGFPCEPAPFLEIGQLVRVEYGALAGLVGFVTDIRNTFRLVISINLLMRSVSAEIDRSWVKPLDSRELAARVRVPHPPVSAAPDPFAAMARIRAG